MVDVFISYSRAARPKAEAIKAWLEAFGVDCFLDLEKIDGGANFPDIIDRALRKSKAVLCCWSPVYFERPWCMIECRDALARNILIPVAIEDFDPLLPPADLRQINWFNLAGWQGESDHEDWRRTLVGLGKLIGRDLLAQAGQAPASETGDEAPAPASPNSPTSKEPNADVLSDLRNTWAAFPAKTDAAAVQRFLERVRKAAPGSGIEFEVEHLLDELTIEAERRARDAERAQAARLERESAAAQARRREEASRRRPGTVWRDPIPGLPNNATPEMITIAPGAFMMGASCSAPDEDANSDEGPPHEVTIDYAFAIGVHVVTFAEWDAAIAVGARLERLPDQGWGRDRRPVINVGWRDANDYIAWLNMRLGLKDGPDTYRLPSEAEWEYACRAGAATPYSSGNTLASNEANFTANSEAGDGPHPHMTAPVGSYKANAFGLYDMHGNVWEWSADAWNASYGEPGRPDDGAPWLAGDATRRVLRGGAWDAGPSQARSASRRSANPTYGSANIGFRVARTLPLFED